VKGELGLTAASLREVTLYTSVSGSVSEQECRNLEK